jgi:hypothetical protein
MAPRIHDEGSATSELGWPGPAGQSAPDSLRGVCRDCPSLGPRGQLYSEVWEVPEGSSDTPRFFLPTACAIIPCFQACIFLSFFHNGYSEPWALLFGTKISLSKVESAPEPSFLRDTWET